VEIERRPGGPTVVLDTNVILSAAFARPGLCAAILRRGASGEFRLVSSAALWDEVRQLLTSSYDLSREDAERWVKILGAPMEDLPSPIPRVRHGGRTLSDGARRALDTALAAKAAYLVTNDPELLRLSLVNGVEILLPSAFLALHSE
jgi:predicted nucleic acid-binding protein